MSSPQIPQVAKPPLQIGEPCLLLCVAKKDFPAVGAALIAAGVDQLVKVLAPTTAREPETSEIAEHGAGSSTDSSGGGAA